MRLNWAEPTPFRFYETQEEQTADHTTRKEWHTLISYRFKSPKHNDLLEAGALCSLPKRIWTNGGSDKRLIICFGLPRVSGGRRKRNVELTTIEFHSQENWLLLHQIDPLHRFYVGAKLGKPSRRSIPFCLFDLLEAEVAKTFTAHSTVASFCSSKPIRRKSCSWSHSAKRLWFTPNVCKLKTLFDACFRSPNLLCHPIHRRRSMSVVFHCCVRDRRRHSGCSFNVCNLVVGSWRIALFVYLACGKLSHVALDSLDMCVWSCEAVSTMFGNLRPAF